MTQTNENQKNVSWPSQAQLLRQLGTVALVVVVWGLLLIGYLGLTTPFLSSSSDEPEPIAETTPEIASPTVPSAVMITMSATPAPLADDTAVPTPQPETTEATVQVSFSQDVLPIFERSCFRCHDADSKRGGLVLETRADVLAGSRDGPVIVPGSAADSTLIELVETGRMPRRGDKLSDQEIQVIRDWIDAGTPDN